MLDDCCFSKRITNSEMRFRWNKINGLFRSALTIWLVIFREFHVFDGFENALASFGEDHVKPRLMTWSGRILVIASMRQCDTMQRTGCTDRIWSSQTRWAIDNIVCRYTSHTHTHTHTRARAGITIRSGRSNAKCHDAATIAIAMSSYTIIETSRIRT